MSTITPPAPRTTTDAPAATLRLRVALVALAGVSLLTGLDAALLRLGLWAPVASDRLADLHGPAMTLGFMGTLISLERAQALRRPVAYLAPALLATGSLALILGAPPMLGGLLLLDGGVAFLAVAVALWFRAPLPLVAAQALGALFVPLAAAALLAADVTAALPLLAAFVVITIAAERAELAQLIMGARAVPTLLALATVVALGAAVAAALPAVGFRVLGVGCVLIAAWLIRDDVGRRMIRAAGFRRFNAAALLAGNLWLAVAGAVWAVVGQPAAHGHYDATIHGVFLGFGVSMIMAHAPTIFPAVIGRPLPYRPSMWLPLGLLHVGMTARILGDLLAVGDLYRTGGIVTVAALLVFALTVVASAVRG
ncbi:hypothetical protein [Tessaracoccus sp. Z1128]